MIDKVRQLDPDLAEFFGREHWPREPGYDTGDSPLGAERHKADIAAERALAEGLDAKVAMEAEAIAYTRANKPQYYERLALRRAAHIERMRINTENVLKEYARIAFFDIRDIYDEQGRLLNPIDLDDDTAAAIAALDITEESIKYKIHDKMKALDALAKRLNLFAEHNKVNVEANVEVSKMSKTERARRVAFLLAEAVKAKASREG
jgi:phage terminase small subunit